MTIFNSYTLKACIIASFLFLGACNRQSKPTKKTSAYSKNKVKERKKDDAFAELDVPKFKCKASENTRKYYNKDAYRLAVRDMQLNPKLKGDVNIPNYLVEQYLTLFEAMNTASSREAQDVMQKHKIHCFPYPYLKSVSLYVDGETSWLSKWHEGESHTGYKPLDDIMQAYQLKEGRLRRIGKGVNLDLRSSQPINVFALIEQLSGLDGVIEASVSEAIGGGNDISVKWTEKMHAIVTFKKGFGDCPSGCINKHYWEFDISPKCDVTFIKEYGDPLEN